MPLTATSHSYLHILQSVSILALAAILATPITYILLLALCVSPALTSSRKISCRRRWRQQSSPAFRPRKVLVTGLGMAKGLSVARTFYRAGHEVIGADFEEEEVQVRFGKWQWKFGKLSVPGQWSKAVKRFYRLPDLKKEDAEGHSLDAEELEEQSENYVERILQIIKDEEINLWVSVSSDMSALEDGEAAEYVSESSSGRCKAIQFGHTLTGTLHDKFSFIQHTRRIGMNVPDTHLITSEAEAMSILYPDALSTSSSSSNSNLNLNQMALEKEHLRMQSRLSRQNDSTKRYIMKSINLDSKQRTGMTALPQRTYRDTEAYIRGLCLSPFTPYVLQELIRGKEYCAHSLIIDGELKAFVACPSKELLVHYTALSSTSLMSRALERYMRLYAERTKDLNEAPMIGHFSVDFLVEEEVAVHAEMEGASEKELNHLVGKLYPIECNPRANTAVLLFSSQTDELADLYLSVLEEREPHGILGSNISNEHVLHAHSGMSYYWIGNDIFTLLFLPLLQLLIGKSSMENVETKWTELLDHVRYQKDGSFEVWDPWPFWWTYVIYWPVRIAIRLLRGRSGRWSRINMATGKIFGC